MWTNTEQTDAGSASDGNRLAQELLAQLQGGPLQPEQQQQTYQMIEDAFVASLGGMQQEEADPAIAAHAAPAPAPDDEEENENAESESDEEPETQPKAPRRKYTPGAPRAKAGSVRKSCDVCSARRVKCDAQMPQCSRCVKNGVACNYSRSKKRGPKKANTKQEEKAADLKRQTTAPDTPDTTGSNSQETTDDPRKRRRKTNTAASESAAASSKQTDSAGPSEKTLKGRPGDRRVAELRVSTTGFQEMRQDNMSPGGMSSASGSTVPTSAGTFMTMDLAGNILSVQSPMFPVNAGPTQVALPAATATGQVWQTAPAGQPAGPSAAIVQPALQAAPTANAANLAAAAVSSPASTLIQSATTTSTPQTIESGGQQYVIIQTQYQPPGVAAIGPGGLQYTPGQLLHYTTGQTIQMPSSAAPGGGPQIYILPQQGAVTVQPAAAQVGFQQAAAAANAAVSAAADAAAAQNIVLANPVTLQRHNSGTLSAMPLAAQEPVQATAVLQQPTAAQLAAAVSAGVGTPTGATNPQQAFALSMMPSVGNPLFAAQHPAQQAQQTVYIQVPQAAAGGAPQVQAQALSVAAAAPAAPQQQLQIQLPNAATSAAALQAAAVSGLPGTPPVVGPLGQPLVMSLANQQNLAALQQHNLVQQPSIPDLLQSQLSNASIMTMADLQVQQQQQAGQQLGRKYSLTELGVVATPEHAFTLGQLPEPHE